jgi:hypothetical protein
MLAKKAIRLSVYGVLCLLLVFSGLQLALNYYFNERVGAFLVAQVDRTSEGEYALSYSSVRISLWNRSVALDDPKLTPRGTVKARETRFRLSAGSITLSGLGIMALWRDQDLHARRISLQGGKLDILLPSDSLKKDSIIEEGRPENMFEKLKQIRIREVVFDNILLRVVCDGKELVYCSENSFRAKGFLMNADLAKSGKAFSLEKVKLNIPSAVCRTRDGFYAIEVKDLRSSEEDLLLSIGAVRLLPSYSRSEFARKKGRQVSRVDLTGSKVAFTGFSVTEFLETGKFICKKGKIGGLRVDIYRDKNLPFVEMRRPSVQQMVRQIPVFMKIDTLLVDSATVVYDHLAENGSVPGRISFDGLTAKLTGLCNDTAAYTADSLLRLEISCLFMNKSLLKGRYIFPLNTVNENFLCEGSLAGMSLTEANHMLENTTSLKVKSGFCDTLKFRFNANEYRSEGWMKFFYHDLELDIMSKKKVKKKWLSFLTRLFIVKKDNPALHKAPRMARIKYDRYPYKTLFYYTWKSIQSGLMDAAGFRSEQLLKRTDKR